jgi:hypothetical protein
MVCTVLYITPRKNLVTPGFQERWDKVVELFLVILVKMPLDTE